jgi:hypothetical protein
MSTHSGPPACHWMASDRVSRNGAYINSVQLSQGTTHRLVRARTASSAGGSASVWLWRRVRRVCWWWWPVVSAVGGRTSSTWLCLSVCLRLSAIHRRIVRIVLADWARSRSGVRGHHRAGRLDAACHHPAVRVHRRRRG